MVKVYLDYDCETPRYACTGCGNCSSIIGRSLCSIQNRGCCWYFPKFELYDIQRMSKTLEGLQVLNTIRQNPLTVVYPYYLHAKGYFDEKSYKEYIDSNNLMETGDIKDHTIFFRACPFVKEGHGCTIPVRYRTFVCNFFICDEIIGDELLKEEFKPYIEERARYSKWLYMENDSLRHLLYEKKINLVDNFEEVVQFLQELPLSIYEFPDLDPINSNNISTKGA